MNPCTIFSTLEQLSLYSICLQTSICQSHQLHKLFRSVRCACLPSQESYQTPYILPVSGSVLLNSKTTNSSCAPPAGRIEADENHIKNGPLTTCLCRFAPHVVCTQCSFWPLISCDRFAPHVVCTQCSFWPPDLVCGSLR